MKALEEVIGSYLLVNIDSDRSIRLYDKPRCLFHYRHELKECADATDDESTKLHVLFCVRYMQKALRQEISTFDNMTEADTPRMNYENLWMVFKPGTPLYTQDEDSEIVYKFKEMHYLKMTTITNFGTSCPSKSRATGRSFGSPKRAFRFPNLRASRSSRT